MNTGPTTQPLISRLPASPVKARFRPRRANGKPAPPMDPNCPLGDHHSLFGSGGPAADAAPLRIAQGRPTPIGAALL